MPKGNKKLMGTPASEGEASGTVCIVEELKDLKKLKEGDVLVVHHSNPAWTLGMLKAVAIISEYGGIICHAAIVAREMGIPCVVGVKNATEVLKNGEQIFVDGFEGGIYELSN